MERNYCINILKCIACLGVVFIHIRFPGITGNIIKNLFIWAVPFFLMIAGYYSYDCNENKLKKRFIKIIKILIFGYLVFLFYRLGIALHNGNVLSWFSSNFNWKSPILFLVFCTIKWAIPLWYLIAMAETYLFWLFVIKNDLQNKILKATWVFFLLDAILTITIETLDLAWSYKINFLCKALPWFMLGYLVKEKYEHHLYKINNSTLLWIITIGWLITLSAVIFNPPINYAYIGIFATAPSIFLLGIKNPRIRLSNSINYIGDRISLYIYIYIFHVPISSVVSIIMKIPDLTKTNAYPYFHPLITLLFTVTVSIFFEIILSKTKLKNMLT